MPDGPGLPSDLLSRKDIAKRLQVHVKTMARWVREGKLPMPDFELDGFTRWRRDTIDAWLLLQKRAADGKSVATGNTRELKGTAAK